MPLLFPQDPAPRSRTSASPAPLPTARLLECLPLRKGMRFVDAACGTGDHFFPVFERLQGEGIFIAAECREEMLRGLFARLEAFTAAPGFLHIEVARARPGRLPLPDSSADLVLFAGARSSSGQPWEYLLELRRVLSPGGVLCLLDADLDGQFERLALDGFVSAGFRWPVVHSGFQGRACLTARKS